MTAIFYDSKKKIILCDSQATDYVTRNVAHLEAIKFAEIHDFVSVTAGNSEVCDTFNAFLRERDFDGAKVYLNANTVEDLQAIVVHKPSGFIAGNMSSGWFKTGCHIAYGGTGGDFLRHNYVVNGENLDVAYDITIKDQYTYTGGEKRYLNLTTGEGNMNELDVVINETAANDSNGPAYNYPVGQKSFDAESINSEIHENVLDIEALLAM